jgi:hypothetical protein
MKKLESWLKEKLSRRRQRLAYFEKEGNCERAAMIERELITELMLTLNELEGCK